MRCLLVTEHEHNQFARLRVHNFANETTEKRAKNVRKRRSRANLVDVMFGGMCLAHIPIQPVTILDFIDSILHYRIAYLGVLNHLDNGSNICRQQFLIH